MVLTPPEVFYREKLEPCPAVMKLPGSLVWLVSSLYCIIENTLCLLVFGIWARVSAVGVFPPAVSVGEVSTLWLQDGCDGFAKGGEATNKWWSQ